MIVATGTIQNVYVQTDSGTADVKIIRAQWQDAWDTYTQLATFTASNTGTTNGTWSSKWVTHGYRLGIAVTGHTTGTNLWWSIEYSQ